MLISRTRKKGSDEVGSVFSVRGSRAVSLGAALSTVVMVAEMVAVCRLFASSSSWAPSVRLCEYQHGCRVWMEVGNRSAKMVVFIRVQSMLKVKVLTG